MDFNFFSKNFVAITYNALGLSTLVVGECPKDTLPLARDCFAIEVTKTNVAEPVVRAQDPNETAIRSYAQWFFYLF
jgi:hypothetical protein